MELAVFYRCLSVMLNAGVHVLRALEAGAAQSSLPAMASAITSARAAVASGKRLSVALSQFPSFFSPLQVRMIAVGENTGGLHVILKRLADHAEKGVALRRKVTSALTYPLFILALSLLLLLAAPSLVFKDLLELLTELGVELPWSTRVVVALAEGLSGPWLYLGAGVFVAGWFAVRRAMDADEEFKARIETAVLALPGIGPALRTAGTAEFCRALSLCYATGLPVMQAIKLCGSGTGSVLMERAAEQARERLTEGETLFHSLAESNLFNPMLLGVLWVGEESGKVADSLERAAELAEEDVDNALEQATALLQPTFMLVIGGVVGFMVVATMSPLVKVLQTL